MEQVLPVRVALARLSAERFGRAVPEEELRRAVGGKDVRPALLELAERRLAIETPHGWRPTSPPRASRMHGPGASSAALHP